MKTKSSIARRIVTLTVALTLVVALSMASGCITKLGEGSYETKIGFKGFELGPMPFAADSDEGPNGTKKKVAYGSNGNYADRNAKARAALAR